MTSSTTRSTDVARFLSLLHEPGDVFEVRAFKCPERVGGSFTSTASGYFSDQTKAAAEVKRLDRLKPPGVYVTINPVKPDLLARAANEAKHKAKATTSDADILRRRWLLVDIDPVRPAEVSATEGEMRAALTLANATRKTMAESHGWPEPLCGCSGNGGYLMYRIDLPNDDDATDLCRRVLHGLANRFDTDDATIDTSTFNASRIAKVFGTHARKGDDLRNVPGIADRPHRMAWFRPPAEELQVVDRELLESFASDAAPASPAAPPKSKKKAAKNSPLERCRTYLAKIGDAIQGQHGSDPTFYAASICARFGLDESDSLAAMADYNATKCHPPWDEKDLAKKIRDARRDVEAKGEVGSLDKQPAAEATPPPSPTFHAEVCRRLEIDVLGEWENGEVEIYSFHHRKSRRIRDPERIKYPKLLQLCGEPAQKYVHNSVQAIPDKFSIGQVRDAICYLAGRQELDHDSLLGMGCWRGRDTSGAETNSIVVVNAREAGVWNGAMRLETIDHPRHGGLLLRIASTQPWVDLRELAGLCEAAGDPAWCDRALQDVTDEFNRWRWAQSYAPIILSGLVAATWIQSLWQFRPQVSITGQSNAGKTFLFTTLESIFGGLAEKLASDSTARGLQQALGGDSRVLLIDEWDRIRPKNRDEIFSLIRRSTRGEKRAVGTQSQKAKTTSMKNIWWTAGIMSNISEEADKNRFISFQLLPASKGQHGKLQLRPSEELAEMGMKLLAIAIRHGVTAVNLASQLKSLTVEGVHPRFIESYAVPCAIAAVAGGMDRSAAESLLREYLESLGDDKDVERDEDSLLQTILSSHVDGGKTYFRRSVGELIEIIRHPNANLQWDEAEDALARVGVAVRKDSITGEERLVIAYGSATRHLLRHTEWEGKTIGEVLRNIPGAYFINTKIGGTSSRCYSIPLPECIGIVNSSPVSDEFA